MIKKIKNGKIKVFADNFFKSAAQKINWKIFDKIYCIHYLPFSDRLTHAISELRRVGIYQSDNFEFVYNVPNKYYNAVLDIPDEKIDKKRIKEKNINLQMNRLNLVRKAQMLGYQRILIVEDDIMFHKDLSLISKYIDNFPFEYDIVNFDYWFLIKEDFLNLKSDLKSYINDLYLDLGKNEKVWNMSFVALSNKGMKYLCDSQENYLRPMDNYIAYKQTNAALANDIKFAISSTNLSIQKLYDDRQNYHAKGFNKYEGQGLNFNNYI